MSEEKLDAELHELGAIAYGEASVKAVVKEELYALASVMIRQRDARGYKSIRKFVTGDKTFSFVVKDGNVRYKKMMKATASEIAKDAGMAMALEAARNALANGTDHSNGAYFWDGLDIKTNYKNHFKVKRGIKFTDPAHNIYDLKESKEIVIKWANKDKLKDGKVIGKEKVEVDRRENVYDSSAAYGGTIFWKHSRSHIRVGHAKEHI